MSRAENVLKENRDHKLRKSTTIVIRNGGYVKKIEMRNIKHIWSNCKLILMNHLEDEFFFKRNNYHIK